MKRIDKRKEVLGRVEVIFRQLGVNKVDGGYAPLLDSIVYAYTFPDMPLTEVIEYLSKEKHYLRIRIANRIDATRLEKIYAEMVHTIKSAIDCPNINYLKVLGLDVMKVILEGKTGEELETVLLDEIGEKYQQYSNDEKIVLFFIKKILKEIKGEV